MQLNTTCILNVPLQSYGDDFYMIVNGKEFKMSRLVSDLLSPKICKIHMNDPTIDRFTIKTQHSSDFSRFLQLISFKEINIQDYEIDFILEIIESLGLESISINNPFDSSEITTDNVFSLIKKNKRVCHFFKKPFTTEIEFIASHFYELSQSHFEDLSGLSIETLSKIFENEKLQMKDEDQLLNFLNKLYKIDRKFCELYEFVIFSNVTSKCIKEFLDVFDFNDLNSSTWKSISQRLQEEINQKDENNDKDALMKTKIRYRDFKETKTFEKKNNEEFSGILNYIMKTSPNEVGITSTKIYSDHYPSNVTLFNDQSKFFWANFDNKENWICFDFQNRRVIPTDYTIRSSTYWNDHNPNPRNWVIEGKVDDSCSWELLSEEKNCSFLDGKGKIHTFRIQNQTSKEFKFIRFRQTGKNGHNNFAFIFDSFELYGNLIEHIE